MKTYELTYIVSSEISSEEAEAFAKEINSFIQNKEGTIISSQNPVAKTLSFPIKGFGSGYFTISEFQIEPERVKEVEEKLQKDGKILRHMINIKKPIKIQKERGAKKEPKFTMGQPEKTEVKEEPASAKSSGEARPEKKIELEDIDKKLDEILGE